MSVMKGNVYLYELNVINYLRRSFQPSALALVQIMFEFCRRQLI